MAQDTVSAEALRERPDLPSRKLQWLQRHDRDCGALYGMLPLCVGMPVALTDHIDRNPDKCLLRGKIGFVHSWIADTEDSDPGELAKKVWSKPPKVVFVQFFEEDENGNVKPASWRIDGTEANGVYPITPVKKDWFLDSRRKFNKLKIKRRQLPLAPAFALTAHAAQGQTFSGGAIVDLCIGVGANPLTSYVALTRVKKLEDLLIYRPFDADRFQRGDSMSRQLLLRVLRGEEIDWAEIEAQYMPRKVCGGCGFACFKEVFRHAVGQNRTDPFLQTMLRNQKGTRNTISMHHMCPMEVGT